MTNISADEARNRLNELIKEVGLSHEPLQISSDDSQAVLVSEEDWRGIQETLYLLDIPGMRESIIEGINTPDEECSEEPGW